jgi:hypothetical protein
MEWILFGGRGWIFKAVFPRVDPRQRCRGLIIGFIGLIGTRYRAQENVPH